MDSGASEWSPFSTEYVRVNRWKVLQLEIHPLKDSEIKNQSQGGRTWFADRHLQEILQLLKNEIFTRVNLTAKEVTSTRPDLITGSSFRLAYAFRKRPDQQFCLISQKSRQFEDNMEPIDGRYHSYHIHREKMVIYVTPIVSGRKSAVSKLLKVLNDDKPKTLGISSYFVKSPRKDNSSQGEINVEKTCENSDSEASKQSENNSKTLEQGIRDKETNVFEEKQSHMKQTLKKYTSKLSKRYKRKGRGHKSDENPIKRPRIIEPQADDSLPDLSESMSDFKVAESKNDAKKLTMISELSEEKDCPKFVNFDFQNKKLGDKKMISSKFTLPTFSSNLRSSPNSSSPSPNSSPIKNCSIVIEKLADEETQAPHISDSHSDHSLLLSQSGIRVSRRMSQIFEMCETSDDVIVINKDAEEELGVILNVAKSELPEVKDEDAQTMLKTIKSVDDVTELTEEQLGFLVHHNESYLRDIFQGKRYCCRHQDYKTGGKSKTDLMYQLHFGKFTDEQSDSVMDTLMSLFCRNHKKYMDYLLKVLLPEMFVKIYMEVFSVEYNQAVAMIRDYSKSEQLQNLG